jgi:hypothetical protein
MATLKNTSLSSTGYLRVPVGTSAQRSGTTQGSLRYNTDTSTIEYYSTLHNSDWQDFTIPWYTRQIVVAGYVMGGYKSSAVWRNVNRTDHSNDTSTDLGDLLARSGNYKSGAVGLDRAFYFGTTNAHNASGNITTGFSMRTDSAFTTQGGSNMGVSRGHMGAVYKEHLSTWITGGGATSVERFDTITEMFHTRPGLNTTAGQGGSTAGGPWGTSAENYGTWYMGEGYTTQNLCWNFTFASETLLLRPGTQPGDHFQQKNISSKLVHGYIGNNGSWAGGYTYRRTNHLTDTTTSGSFMNKAYTNCGEENYTLGNDKSYMLGQYNGLQNNLSAKFIYASETQTTGGSTMEPKGPAGRSSGFGAWRG